MAAATARPRQTFPRSRRLRRRPEFLRVQNTGARVTTRHLLILLAPRGEAPRAEAPAAEEEARRAVGLAVGKARALEKAPRLGLVASRKVGGAVQRNRAKRLLREVFRRRPDLFPAHVDVVIIIRPGLHELTYTEVEAEIASVASLLRKRAAGGRPPRPPTERGPERGAMVGKDRKPRGPDGSP